MSCECQILKKLHDFKWLELLREEPQGCQYWSEVSKVWLNNLRHVTFWGCFIKFYQMWAAYNFSKDLCGNYI